MTNTRFPELRVDDEMAGRISAHLAETGETYSAFARAAMAAYLDLAGAPRKRQRRGGVSAALRRALSSVTFEARDEAAVGLAKSLAARLDEVPPDHKYIAGKLLDVLGSLRLTPAARLGVIAPVVEPQPTATGAALVQLRLQVESRRAGLLGLTNWLHLRRPEQRTYGTPEQWATADEITRLMESLV